MSIWPKEWHSMSHDQRRDDLLARMLAMPPEHHVKLKGKSVRLPKQKTRKPDPAKPKGFMNTIPSDGLLAHINRVVPPMSHKWRDDLVQELAIAVVTGEIEESALDDFRSITKYRNKVMAMYPPNRSYASPDSTEAIDLLTQMISDGETHDFTDLQAAFKKRGGS